MPSVQNRLWTLRRFVDAREDTNIGVVLFTGAGPHTDGKYAFCAGGDQSVRGTAGYVDDDGIRAWTYWIYNA